MRLGLAICLFAVAGAVLAAPMREALLIDTESAQARFALRALWVKRIDGDFDQVQGVIERDTGTGLFDVDVRIAAASVRMPNPDHAEWARSDDFFDAARHPWIGFRATDQPERLLREGGVLDGELTLRGITRPMQFEVEPAPCPRPGLDCAVQARGELERSEFGMTARRLFISDRVRLELSIRVHPATAPATP
jgi:polyisoprenoid-binding protein YceI